jgi:hypothetical protein
MLYISTITYNCPQEKAELPPLSIDDAKAGAGSFLGNNSGRSAIENAQIASAAALVFSWDGSMRSTVSAAL